MTTARLKRIDLPNGSAPVPLVQDEASALVHMIDRAARDVSIPLDRLQQLMEMRERVEARNAERDFDIAMAEAQSEMRPVAADSNNPQTKSRYASYVALDKALRPIYSKHGLVLSFNTEEGAPESFVRVSCRVSRAGHTRAYRIDMPADGKGAKGGDVMTKTHATGSAVSYGMRYLLKMIFNVSVGEDDDGNAATAEPLAQQQADNLRDLLEAKGAPLAKFLTWARVERIEDIAASRYDACVKAINQYGGAR